VRQYIAIWVVSRKSPEGYRVSGSTDFQAPRAFAKFVARRNGRMKVGHMYSSGVDADALTR
jgi:seryl-tRNA synthetase